MRMLIQLQSDDLNDSEMLANYADKMKGAGYNSLSQKFAARAKMRSQHFVEDEKELRDFMDRMKNEGENAPASVQAHCLLLMLEAQRERYYMVKSKIEAMKSNPQGNALGIFFHLYFNRR